MKKNYEFARPDIQFAAQYYNETKDFGTSRIEMDFTDPLDAWEKSSTFAKMGKTYDEVYEQQYVSGRIKAIQKELKPAEARALILHPDKENEIHATLLVITKDRTMMIVQNKDDKIMLDAIRKKIPEIYTLDINKFAYNTVDFLPKGRPVMQSTPFGCAVMALDIAKKVLAPRTDGKEGRMAHQMLETCKNAKKDITLEGVDPQTARKILKLAQSTRLLDAVPDLKEKLKGKGYIQFSKNNKGETKEINSKLMSKRSQYAGMFIQASNLGMCNKEALSRFMDIRYPDGYDPNTLKAQGGKKFSQYLKNEKTKGRQEKGWQEHSF